MVFLSEVWAKILFVRKLVLSLRKINCFNNMKKILFAVLAAMALPLFAQQSHVNIQFDPQRNTENIRPYSTSVISPEVHDDNTVTFRINAPKAQEVLLTGSMFVGNDSRRRVPFEKKENGLWELTIGPLKPEIYFYYFITYYLS